MAVDDQERARIRAAGKAKGLTKAPVDESAAFESGREDMRDCVANSTRLFTKKAVLECGLKLRK